MTFNDYVNIATIIGVIIALLASIKGLIEYRRNNTRKIAERFIKMRIRFKEHPTFKKIYPLLTNDDDPEWKSISYQERGDFIAFFEELALMMFSRLIRKEIVYYMFGWYILKVKKCEKNLLNYKEGNGDKEKKLNILESNHWALFRDLLKLMEDMEKTYEYKRKDLRF